MQGNIENVNPNALEQQRLNQLSMDEGFVPSQASNAHIARKAANDKSQGATQEKNVNQPTTALDTIAQKEPVNGSNPSTVTVNGQVIYQQTPIGPGEPELAAPTVTLNNEAVEEVNTYLNSTVLTTLTEALELMALSMQKQKIIDKTTELKLADLTYKMAVASADLTIQLGKLEQMEHIWKGITVIAAGVATGFAAKYLPQSGTAAGANKMMFYEIMKSFANAASEFVSAGYALPKATLQALKQIKDQCIQLLMANKESSAAQAKEDQDNLDRIIQSIQDVISKQKRAFEVAG
jgi:hypothetical protein